jgi:perosamine synthetase
MRTARQRIALAYLADLAEIAAVEPPAVLDNRVHAWHLFPIRLRLERLSVDRNRFLDELRAAGVGCSVHWRPLHLHRYYQERFGWTPAELPVATTVWERLISLPLFPDMQDAERAFVVTVVRDLCQKFRA